MRKMSARLAASNFKEIKMIKLIPGFLLIILLAGCSSILPVADGVALSNEINRGKVKEALVKVDLTPAEEQIITHALNKVASFRSHWGSYFNNPGELISIDADQLIADYNELRNQFNLVNAIGTKNFHRYDADTQMQLSIYQQQAYDFDAQVQSYLEKRDFRSAMRKGLAYGFATLQLIASFK